MNAATERRLRFVEADAQTHPSTYWRSRTTSERLHAVLALHHEGNALFKDGNSVFVLQWKLQHVQAR